MEITGCASITVSDFLEKKATEEEKKQKLDIADYLIKSNAPSFPESQATDLPITTQDTAPVNIVRVPALHQSKVQEAFFIPEPEETENWEAEIKELEVFFTNASFPPQLK